VLSLRVKHETQLSENLLCAIDISVGKLLEGYDLTQGMSAPVQKHIHNTDFFTAPDIKLCLKNSGTVGRHQGPSQVTVRITKQENLAAGTAVIADARKALRGRGLANTGALQSLTIVISKLDTFVKIVDQTAKVDNFYYPLLRAISRITLQIHPYSYLVWQVTSSTFKVCHTRHLRFSLC